MTRCLLDAAYVSGLPSVPRGSLRGDVTLAFDDSGVHLHGPHGMVWEAAWAEVKAVEVSGDDEGYLNPGPRRLLLLGPVLGWLFSPKVYDTYVTVVTEREHPVVRVDTSIDQTEDDLTPVRRRMGTLT